MDDKSGYLGLRLRVLGGVGYQRTLFTGTMARATANEQAAAKERRVVGPLAAGEERDGEEDRGYRRGEGLGQRAALQ